jgi:hypothetical protein
VDGLRACGRTARAPAPDGHTAGVTNGGGTIEIPPEQVYALAAHLGAQAAVAEETADRLGSPPAIGGPLQPAVEDFLLCHRTAAHALAGEFRWLGSTIAAVVDSWLHLDGSVLAPRGQATPR